MKENLLDDFSGNIRTDFLLDIDVEHLSVGSTTLIDYSGNHPLDHIVTPLPSNNNFKVINHPTFGKCFNFDGTNGFYSLNKIDLHSIDFIMNLSYVKTNTTPGTIFETGTYPSSGTRITNGINIMLDQVSSMYFQVFLSQSNGNYTRVQVPGYSQGPNVLESFTVVKQGINYTAVNNNTNISASGSRLITGDDLFCIGFDGSYNRLEWPFIGLLKSIRIQQID